MLTSPVDSGVNRLEEVAKQIDNALALIRMCSSKQSSRTSALDRMFLECLEMCGKRAYAPSEPIRTLHHFSCTGGTLISRCIAAMPNTQLLSEVDPLSAPLKPPAQPQFTPTDIVTLMRQSTRGVDDALIVELFLNNLAVIYARCSKIGQHIVLRDHAHSHFCRGGDVARRPTLMEMVTTKFPVLSLVTVRNPVDSFLSLHANGWVHYSPATFNEYCFRYIAFLNEYRDVPIVRYEDFVRSPRATMKSICSRLALSYNDDFLSLFSVNRLTGNSGRAADTIEERPRRTIGQELAGEVARSDNYGTLMEVLGYDKEAVWNC